MTMAPSCDTNYDTRCNAEGTWTRNDMCVRKLVLQFLKEEIVVSKNILRTKIVSKTEILCIFLSFLK